MITHPIKRTGLFAAALVVGGLSVGGLSSLHSSTASAMAMPTFYKATLNPLNNSGAHGVAIVEVEGNQATIMTQTQGLSVGLPHAQHLHFGAAGTCPDPSADKNKDGLISVAEAAPNYGAIRASLTTSGDYSAASALAVERFPVGGANGVTTYSRTITLPEGINADNLGNGVIVQHGISTLFGDPTKYDGSTPSSIAPNLPIEATIPADCGTLTKIDMPSMNMTPAQTFNTTMAAAITQLRASTSMTAAVDEFSSSYATATQQFANTLMMSSSQYNENWMMNRDNARNVYIDQFNNAKATYFNSLDQAKNVLAQKLSGHDDVAKDHFMNAFNSSRDMFGNQLEQLKNELLSQL